VYPDPAPMSRSLRIMSSVRSNASGSSVITVDRCTKKKPTAANG
jgi:hypothetical protein